MKAAILAAILLASGSSSATLAAPNLVANGGFETGDFTDWTANPSSNNPWTVTSDGPTDGAYAASTGCVGPQCTGALPIISDALVEALPSDTSAEAYLSQTIATTAGTSYTLSFDYTPDAGIPNELKVLFGDTAVTDLINVADTPNLVSYTFGGLVASGNSTVLEFLGRQDPGFDRLDNVSLVASSGTSVSAAPEPGSWIMMILGFGLVGGAIRYSYRKSEENFTRKVQSLATA